MLRSDLARDPSFLARFPPRGPVRRRAQPPAIVAVYDSGEDQDTESGGATVALPYIVMEYVEGRTLREILNESSVMEPDEAARSPRVCWTRCHTATGWASSTGTSSRPTSC